MLPARKTAVWIARLGVAALLGMAAPAPPAAAQVAPPQTYDCQARITRPQAAPPARAGNADAWQCKTPHNARMSPALHWFRDSLEYCRAATSAYADATAAAYRAAVKYGPGGWIVLMDADETVLDNSLYEREREACDAGFSPATWEAWIKAGEAGDVPGAALFTQTVHALGGFVAIVTNREAADDRITRRNLRALGIHFDYETGLPVGGKSDKVARWRAGVAALAARTHASPKPAIWVGDQVTDFPILDANGDIVRAMSEKDAGEGIGERFFIIPNPVYGGWTSNPAH